MYRCQALGSQIRVDPDQYRNQFGHDYLTLTLGGHNEPHLVVVGHCLRQWWSIARMNFGGSQGS